MDRQHGGQAKGAKARTNREQVRVKSESLDGGDYDFDCDDEDSPENAVQGPGERLQLLQTPSSKPDESPGRRDTLLRQTHSSPLAAKNVSPQKKSKEPMQIIKKQRAHANPMATSRRPTNLLLLPLRPEKANDLFMYICTACTNKHALQRLFRGQLVCCRGRARRWHPRSLYPLPWTFCSCASWSCSRSSAISLSFARIALDVRGGGAQCAQSDGFEDIVHSSQHVMREVPQSSRASLCQRAGKEFRESTRIFPAVRKTGWTARNL